MSNDLISQGLDRDIEATHERFVEAIAERLPAHARRNEGKVFLRAFNSGSETGRPRQGTQRDLAGDDDRSSHDNHAGAKRIQLKLRRFRNCLRSESPSLRLQRLTSVAARSSQSGDHRPHKKRVQGKMQSAKNRSPEPMPNSWHDCIILRCRDREQTSFSLPNACNPIAI